MSIPPGQQEYPDIKCPECGKVYKLTQLDVDDSEEPPQYFCPNCDAQVYQPEVES